MKNNQLIDQTAGKLILIHAMFILFENKHTKKTSKMTS